MSETTKATSVEIHYLKTGNYRTYHADGAFGGITPKGNIYLELFLERHVTPRKVRYELTEDGVLGAPLETEGKSGVVREIECGLILDLATAVTLHDFLGKIITQVVQKQNAT